ncbi:MAG: hypothetical protein ACRC3Z_09735 [Phocaeicola sp.]
MTRTQIIQELKQFFSLQEFVCQHTYIAFGDRAWQFLDTELLHSILVIRKFLNRAMIINNWHKNGSFSQRGLRCNVCQLVKDKTTQNKIYLTSHANGAGIDFHVVGMTPEQVRTTIAKNEILLPYPIRLERDVNWVHLDIYDYMNGKKINYFNG